MFRRTPKPSEPDSDFEHLLAPVACVKCGRLFAPTQRGGNETECFTCAPRAAIPLTIVNTVSEKNERRRHRRFSMERDDGIRNMQHGGVVFVLGSFVTIATYAFAHSTGGFFVVAWGAILFGGLRFLYGVTQYFS